MVIKNLFSLNVAEIIDRLKLYSGIPSDNLLSTKLGKSINYISKCRSSNTIDFELLFTNFYNIDFNWLVTGNNNKTKLYAVEDEETGKIIYDLNSEVEDLKIENIRLKVENKLLWNINNAKYGELFSDNDNESKT